MQHTNYCSGRQLDRHDDSNRQYYVIIYHNWDFTQPKTIDLWIYHNYWYLKWNNKLY